MQPIKGEPLLPTDPYAFDITTRVLRPESHDDMTSLQHAFLVLRHTALFHPDQFEFDGGRVPEAFDAFLEEMADYSMFDGPASIDPRHELPEPEEIHTFLHELLHREITHVLRGGRQRPGDLLEEAWETGVFELLVLRLIELVVDHEPYMYPPAEPTVIELPDRECTYDYEVYRPFDHEDVPMLGTVDDMAYRVIAHTRSARVTVEAIDGSAVYAAVEQGRLLGDSPIDPPVQGTMVRVRQWLRHECGQVTLSTANLGAAEEAIQGRVYDRSHDLDQLVFVRQRAGDTHVLLSWHVWLDTDMMHKHGWMRGQETDGFYCWPADDLRYDDDFDTATARFTVEHRPIPDWATRPGGHAHDVERYGEQREWGFGLPWMYRVLASPNDGLPMLRAPQRGEPRRGGATAYWASLLHLLIYHLGWGDPAVGITRWQQAGKPTNDKYLALLREVWDRDGQLDAFVAWLWTSGIGAYFTGNPPRAAMRAMHKALRPADDWFEEVERKRWELGAPSPFGGGEDPLHLLEHVRAPLAADKVHRWRSTLDGDVPGSEFVLTVRGLIGWYSQLLSHRRRLEQELDDPNYKIRVLVGSVGDLGTFRANRRTGRLHACSTSAHLLGN